MGVKFHIDRHGVPAICNSLISACPYGNERHFKSYEDAKEYIDRLGEEMKLGVFSNTEDPAKKIKSYYSSESAINEFPLNKRVADLENFDLVIISWLTKRNVEEGMKHNCIGKAKFTYGDIVRILDEKIKKKFGEELKLEDKYYNPIPFDYWENPMKIQMNIYRNTTRRLSKELGFESMEIVSLPISARRNLHKDGFLMNPDNIHEVVYKVFPAISQAGDIISYSHNTKRMSKEFDIYELAGVVEGKSLHDICYSGSIESKFKSLWNNSRLKSQGNIDYERAVVHYKREQFFKGLEATDVTKAFIRMSPIVAQEVSSFIKNYRAIMFAVEGIMSKQGITEIENEYEYEEDDGDWVIE